MKKYLAWILIVVLFTVAMPSASLAQTVKYEPVQVILRANDELKYREAAAEVIDMYYAAYCMYNTDYTFANQLQEVVSRTGVSSEALKGIYREYYLTAELKFEFDTEERKTKYSSARPDDPKKAAEWDKQQKEIYMTMLSDTIAEKVKANPEQWIGKSYSFNMKTGNFEYDPYMGALNSIENQKHAQALTSFAIELAETLTTVYVDYTMINSGTSDDFAKRIADSAINAWADIMSEGFNTAFENEIKNLENRLIALAKEKIRENVEQADGKIVEYLRGVYENRNPDFEKMFTDPVTRELLFGAVDDMLTFIDSQGKQDALNETSRLIDEWFEVNGFKIEEILDGGEVVKIVFVTAISNIAQIVINELKRTVDEIVGGMVDAHSPILPPSKVEKNEDPYLFISNVFNAFFNGLSSAISTACDETIDDIKDPNEGSNDEFVRKFAQSFSQNMIKDISKTLATNFKEDRFKSHLENFEEAGANWFTSILGRIAQAQKAYTAYLEGDTELSNRFWADFFNDLLTALLNNMRFKDLGEDLADKASDILSNENSPLHKKLLAWAEIGLGKTCEGIAKLKENALKYVSPDKWYDLIYEPAKAGAEVLYNGENAWRDEDQDSLRAANTFAAYTVSNKYRQMVNIKLSEMIIKAQNSDLKQVITDPDLIPIEDIRDTISYIMLQVEQDQVGQKWLMDILGKNENEFWDSNFYNYLMRSIKPSEIWTNNMTLDKATQRYNDMNDFASVWSDLLSVA